MNDMEQKAIKWMHNVRDDAIVTLDHIAKNEPNVSPMLYAGRKEKAEAIIKGFEELEQYRKYGSLDDMNMVASIADDICNGLRKQHAKKPTYEGDGYAPDGTFVWDE